MRSNHRVCGRATSLSALLAAGLMSLALVATSARGAAPDGALDPEERALCKLINQLRAQAGAAPLRISPALTKAANWLSFDMASNDTFDHVDSRGRDVGRRFGAFGYRGPTKGENIAAGEASASATFSYLRSSPVHRRNMLRSKFTVIGIGRAHAEESTFGWYWTTAFGVGSGRGVAC